jgi:hypothetical protein
MLTLDLRFRHGRQATEMHLRFVEAVDPSSVGDADGVRASIFGMRRRRLLWLWLGCDMAGAVLRSTWT